MLKRKKKAKAKARVSHTRRKAKRVVKRAVAKRRKPMAKKKSTEWEDEPVAAEEDVEGSEEEDADEVAAPEPTTTEASEDGVYVVDSPNDVAIKSQVYKKGDHVTLTPEELEAVQAAGVRILPVT